MAQLQIHSDIKAISDRRDYGHAAFYVCVVLGFFQVILELCRSAETDNTLHVEPHLERIRPQGAMGKI